MGGLGSGGAKPQHPKVKALHRAGVTLKQFAKRCHVTYRFAQVWAKGDSSSSRLDRAHERIVRKKKPATAPAAKAELERAS